MTEEDEKGEKRVASITLIQSVSAGEMIEKKVSFGIGEKDLSRDFLLFLLLIPLILPLLGTSCSFP